MFLRHVRYRTSKSSFATILSFSRQYHFKKTLLDELKSRGMISQMTSPSGLADELTKNQSGVYLGVDPTANALHVGHLLPFMLLLHFHLRGHQVYSVVGGATGLVGDPSGKLEERTPLGDQKAEHNVSQLKAGIDRFFNSAVAYANARLPGQLPSDPLPSVKIVNNLDWIGGLNLLEFLRDVGRHARVPAMISRDSVRIRMESKQGISFTEFTYQLLQAYDFYHLHRSVGCSIQIGGQDQWGNIIAGVDLIDRTRNSESTGAHGLTTPLLTTSSGQKFGKSEGNAVWLDPTLTSVLDFYQFFLRTADADVANYLKMFTLLDILEVDEILAKHNLSPESRTAQRLLAEEVTELVHGKSAVKRTQITTKVLFETSLQDLRADEIIDALQDDPRLVACKKDEVVGKPLAKIAARFKLVTSNSEANRLVNMGGLYLNYTQIKSSQVLQEDDLLDGKVVVLRAGRDKHLILAVD